MFGRYKRLVPKAQRDLIKRHRLPKPDWYVGSAESSFHANDPEIRAAIDRIKAAIDKRANEKP